MKRSQLERKAPLRRRKPRKRPPRRKRRAYRSAVLLRAGGRCERCSIHGSETPLGFLDVHHRLPRSRGGSDCVENLVALCRPCHEAIHHHTADDWRDWIVATAPRRTA